MSQLFPPSADIWFRVALIAILAVLVGGPLLAMGLVRSDWWQDVNVAPAQPVPFSHQHHVAGLGIDCRYCHTSVETTASAGLPPTHTCMTCHSQIWTEAPMLAPVRDSLATGKPLHWARVTDLPDFVFFNHSVHIRNGVGCETCHGRIDRMPLVHQAHEFTMMFCVSCHRDPGPHLRPQDAVFEMGWKPPEDPRRYGERMLKAYHIDATHLDDCYTCHR
jgi:hypothetical protein